ncbi:hypothetical protein ACFPRL_34695 [Pseudoclavibacter helvolus]|uniref:DUF7882 family protein n=1 Tax=Pseudoclavibacter helvolus TaxID=255205 RepID=UPI00360BFB9B
MSARRPQPPYEWGLHRRSRTLGAFEIGRSAEGVILGFLYYGSGDYSVEIDDRALAHVKVAMLSLLRAGHSFAFSHPRPATQGGGRETLWVSPSIELRFRFRGSRPPRISADWLQSIIESADTQAGMRLVPEPQTGDAVPHLSAKVATPPRSKARTSVSSQLRIGSSQSGGSHGSKS